MSKFKSNADPQPVFDALDAFLAGMPWAVSSNASINLDGSGTTHSISATGPNNTNSVTYTERIGGVRVSVQPTTASLGPGQSQQFTASAFNPDGSPFAGAAFTWAITGAAQGSIDANGLYTAPATVAAAAIDSVTCTLIGQNSWAVVNVALVPPAGR